MHPTSAGTIDIDLNVFVDVGRAGDVFAAPLDGLAGSPADMAAAGQYGQVRVWWEGTPVDVFWNTTKFHVQAAERIRREQFAGSDVPFLSCTDLAVFKAFSDRTRDWADLEEMLEVGSLDIDRLIGVLVRHLGTDDGRITRLRPLASSR